MKELTFSDFLNDITYKSSYKFLEQGKDDDELEEVSKKRGVVLPAADLAPFKCIYGYVDVENKNGCTLPKEEVEASISTLIGKPIDFDHLRKKIVGHWIDAKIENNTIIAYGMFYKNNLEDDYDTIKELMEEDVLAISFEAWGDRVYKEGEEVSYDLNNIEFAGGALLIKTSPAFPGAQVLELSSKKDDVRVLEMASTLKQPEKLLTVKDERKEVSNYDIWDTDSIRRIVNEAKKPKGFEDSYWEIISIDFENSTAKLKFYDYENNKEVFGEIKLTSGIKLVKSTIDSGFKKENSKMDELKKEMEELKAKYAADIDASSIELAEVKAKLEEAEKELTKAGVDLEKFKADFDASIEKAKKEATCIVERRTELAEFAKDLSDEQILDDKEFKIAKLEKENANLKEVVKGSTEKDVSLDTGSVKGQDPLSKDELLILQKSIQDKAWK